MSTFGNNIDPPGPRNMTRAEWQEYNREMCDYFGREDESGPEDDGIEIVEDDDGEE